MLVVKTEKELASEKSEFILTMCGYNGWGNMLSQEEMKTVRMCRTPFSNHLCEYNKKGCKYCEVRKMDANNSWNTTKKVGVV